MAGVIVLNNQDWQMLQYLIYALIGAVILCIVLLSYAFMRTPLIEFLKADFLKRKLIPYMTSTRRLKLIAVKEKTRP